MQKHENIERMTTMNNNLRLNRVRIKKLFSRFTYDINLVNDENISILIAPNGCGKTTIFNIISFIFKPTITGYRNIINVPFESCECTLSNQKVVVLKKKTNPIDKESWDDSTYVKRVAIERGLSTIRNKESAELSLSVKGEKTLYITKKFRDYAMNADEELPFIDEEEIVSLDEEDYYMVDLPASVRARYRKLTLAFGTIYEYLEKHECSLAINYIKADRLHRKAPMDDMVRYYRRPVSSSIHNPLSLIQKKTRKMYKDITDEYNDLQREMKDRLPKMYLDMDSDSATMDFETFKRRWEDYLSNIEKYCEIGLLASKQTVLEMNELEEAFKKRRAFLTVYLEAFEKTLEPLERNYTRLKLFVDILNRRNRVTHKIIKYGEEGIIVSVDGKTLPLDCLSSGEKNDFIMFYNLIFDSEKNGLVLIDEPEISLHIEWQEEYLDCLIDICDMNSLQAIVATHSPNIVNGHFELYAERGLTDGH